MMVLVEKTESRRTVVGKYGTTKSVTKVYVLTGTSNEVVAKQYVKNETEASYEIEGLLGTPLYIPRSRIDLEPDWTDEDTDRGKWDVTVDYEAAEKIPTTVTGIFGFDTGGGTFHITQSKETIAKYPPASTDHGGAIGYDGERVVGVDIVVPIQQFPIRFYHDNSVVTEAFRQRLADLTGTVNDAFFKGYEKGEVLFMGASGSLREDLVWEFVYKFAVSRNKVDLTIGTKGSGHEIVGIDKEGWQHMWVEYESAIDETVHRPLKRPVAVYIEKVYDYESFFLLGIGV